jgi:hypothetical protein
MAKLIILLGLALAIWRVTTGRWPWESGRSVRRQALDRARNLLGVKTRANRQEIIEAHRRLLAMVHPDRGGTADLVHEANAARDLLLGALSED